MYCACAEKEKKQQLAKIKKRNDFIVAPPGTLRSVLSKADAGQNVTSRGVPEDSAFVLNFHDY